MVLVQESAALGLKRVHRLDRLRARVWASRLDRQLASGVSPESSVVMALHAARLYGSAQRRGLAVGLRNVVVAARNPMPMRTPISREAVRQSEPELQEIAERLESGDPIDVCGVARVRWLLTDGASPFYGHTRPEQLKRELHTTLWALDAAS